MILPPVRSTQDSQNKTNQNKINPNPHPPTPRTRNEDGAALARHLVALGKEDQHDAVGDIGQHRPGHDREGGPDQGRLRVQEPVALLLERRQVLVQVVEGATPAAPGGGRRHDGGGGWPAFLPFSTTFFCGFAAAVCSGSGSGFRLRCLVRSILKGGGECGRG